MAGAAVGGRWHYGCQEGVVAQLDFRFSKRTAAQERLAVLTVLAYNASSRQTVFEAPEGGGKARTLKDALDC